MKIKAPKTARPGARAAPSGKARKTGKTFSLDPSGDSAKPAPGALDATRAGRAAATNTPTMPQALQDLEQQRKRIDKLLAQAARGRSFSPQQLLKLQATVYRYGQDLEVLSRVVDKTVGALKQTLNTQV